MLPNVIYIAHDAKLQQIFYIANDLSKKVQKFFILQSRVCKIGYLKTENHKKDTS